MLTLYFTACDKSKPSICRNLIKHYKNLNSAFVHDQQLAKPKYATKLRHNWLIIGRKYFSTKVQNLSAGDSIVSMIQ
jgi:hypothetical protein